MLIPKPMPDEVFKGFLTRICILNRVYSMRQLLIYLSPRKTRPLPFTKNTFSALRILSDKTNLDLMQLVCSHTLIPYIQVFSVTKHEWDFSNPRWLNTLSIVGTRPILSHARYCPECVDEDLGFWGYTYWRRSHQLPGIEWCLKHQTCLITVPKIYFSKLPPSSTELLSPPNKYKYAHHPVIEKYAQISIGLLDSRSSFIMNKIGMRLGDAARKSGFMVSPKGKKKLLSDLALESIPFDWLVNLFPEFATKTPNMYLNYFDSVCQSRRSQMSTKVFALAAALLYPNADEGLYQLTH